jgi:hypothetical protein
VCRDGAAAAHGERLERVEIEVGEHALEEHGVASDDEIGRLDGNRERHVGRQHDRATCAVDERRDVRGLERDGLAAREPEHGADDALGAPDLGRHLLEVAEQLVAILDVAPREKQRGLGDGERIAKLVRYARPDRAGTGEPRRALRQIDRSSFIAHIREGDKGARK